MHDLPLLVNIGVALATALAGGLLARLAGVPTLVGYLLAGVAIGPFTPGFVGDQASIGQLAELGVIFLMFGVGLHFSLRDLWKVRHVAVPGALGQTALATLLAYGLTRAWGWTPSASLVLGLAISVASTVVLLRGLMDTGQLHSRPGAVAVGWLVLEDILTVLLLLVLPALASTGGGFDGRVVLVALAKAAAFIAVMMLIGSRVVPWSLLRIAHTGSRELFLLLALSVALGIALASAALFGVSLALGAFLAGVVVKESPFSHQVGADLLPFREAFAVLFFVSVGMLVDPAYVVRHAGAVLALLILVVLGKALVAALICLALRQPLRTALVVAAGLSQIGEFSFILGLAGVKLGILQAEQYALILAVSLVSITLNPLMFAAVAPVERVLGRWIRRAGRGPAPGPVETLAAQGGGHVVVVGCGRVGSHVVGVLGQVGVPRLVIESDASAGQDLRRQGLAVLFGDAASSEILEHAHLPKARALVVTIPDESAAALVVAAARRLAPDLPIVARAATLAGVRHLAELGAQEVIHPELEGGLEVLRLTLLRLGFPLREVGRYADVVRRENYNLRSDRDAEHHALARLLEATRSLEIDWVRLAEGARFVGRTLAEIDLRARAGASVIALQREGQLIANPTPGLRLRAGDRVGLIGEADQVEAAGKILQEAGEQEAGEARPA